MTAPSTTPLVERVAVAMWDTWNRVMVVYGLHKQSNGGFYDPEPTDDPIKAEAHRLLRRAAIDEAQAALAACHAEEMAEALRMFLTDKTLIRCMADYNKGHLSHANYLNQRLRPVEILLAKVATRPDKTKGLGYCPVCGAAGIAREKRPDGNDRCEAGHTYPSRQALLARLDGKPTEVK